MPLNSSTKTRTMVNMQLGPLVIPTHSLGFHEFVAMCLPPVYFCLFVSTFLLEQ
jgi:hypothetical protein